MDVYAVHIKSVRKEYREHVLLTKSLLDTFTLHLKKENYKTRAYSTLLTKILNIYLSTIQ